jgi:hypothetical protein
MSTAVFVGLDMAKATLDVAVRPSGEHWNLPNDEPSVQDLVERLRRCDRWATGPLHLSGQWEYLLSAFRVPLRPASCFPAVALRVANRLPPPAETQSRRSRRQR